MKIQSLNGLHDIVDRSILLKLRCLLKREMIKEDYWLNMCWLLILHTFNNESYLIVDSGMNKYWPVFMLATLKNVLQNYRKNHSLNRLLLF